MTGRASVIEDADFISRRMRELRDDTTKAIAGEADCQCPTSPNARGVEIKVHAPSCLLWAGLL